MIPVETLKFLKFKINHKNNCPSIFDMVGSKVIQNTVHLQKKCSILSPNDKMSKNASETDFSNKISRDFVCIFSIFSILNFFEAE